MLAILALLSRHPIISFSILVMSLFGGFWTLLEAGGTSGSWKVAAGLAASAITTSLLIHGFLRPIRWNLIYHAVRKKLRTEVGTNVLHKDTILIGAGAGSALAIGMLMKSLQAENRDVPVAFLLTLRYTPNGQAIVDGPLPSDLLIRQDNILIVMSHIGSGSCLQAIRKFIDLPEARVFAFVVNSAARVSYDYHLTNGSYEMLPWPRTASR